MEVMPAEPFLLKESVGFRCGIHGGKTKTPPSGRGGVLRPAATPGEETRLKVRPYQSARARQVPSAAAYLFSWGGGKHFIEIVPDDGVAFAGDLFECQAIDDVDETAAITDETGALQQAGRDRHGGAAHTEHLPEKFLRQRDRIAVDAIMRLQQPAAKPRLQRMERIARDRLLDLRKQQIVVAHDEVADGLAFVGGRMKLGGREPRGRARQLHDRSAEGRPRAQRGTRADDAAAPDGRGLDRRSALHHRHQRHHAGNGKIDVLDVFPHVVQHYAALERDRAQMRRKEGKVVRRQRRQESVELSVLELPRNKRRAVWHRCAPALRRRPASPPRRSNQAKIASNDSAQRSAYRTAGSMSRVQKKFQSRRCDGTKILSPARKDHQMRRRTAGRPVCDAVNDVRRHTGKAGERNQAPGANPYAFASETYGRKLVS